MVSNAFDMSRKIANVMSLDLLSLALAIGNINAKIVNRTTKMCVVDSQCQYPFMVACLLNAVSLRGSICITIVL